MTGTRRAAAGVLDRRFIFSIASVAVLSCKLLHIYVHLLVLSRKSLVLWLPSLFAQDIAVLLLLRVMMEPSWFGKPLRVLCLLLAALVALVQLGVAASNITFFIMIGAEPRWRNIGLVADPSSWVIMMTGAWSFAGTICGLLFAALILATPIYAFTGAMVGSIKALLTVIATKFMFYTRSGPKYDPLAQEEEDLFSDDEKGLRLLAEPKWATPKGQGRGWLLRLAGAVLALQVVNSALRPPEQAFTFLSWTSLALPAVDYLTSNDQPLAELAAVYQDGLVEKWDRPSTLAEPRRWPWLDRLENLAAGFSDWDGEDDKTHYNPELDPLSHRNYDRELLPSLQGKLADVNIRNVVVLFLESTRKDVFPLKKDEWIWSRLQETWSDGKFSDEAYERAKTLTANARLLTGDYNDGFEHAETPRRGGINVQRNTPSATYTLKSLAGGLCGISPLVADTNLDYDNHIYQPCLPHLFNTFNALHQGTSPDKPDYVGRSWNNSFMMSVTGQYDHQYELMQAIGYGADEMVDSEYLQSDDAAFGPTIVEEIRYDGMPEVAVEDYIRDAFQTSSAKGSRLFLTHLTSSTHFPYGLPENETYVPLVQDDAGEDLHDISKHLNAVGYVDRWVGKILDIIEEQGATNETLVVLLGDHGVPVIETGGASPWGVPLIGSYLVPMVFSHPQLPVVDVPELVSSMSMLPTVLDLLIETGSLSTEEEEAARDLLHGYEAPSLLRPLSPSPSDIGAEERQWYFTSVSPGGQAIAVRSMDEPRWRVLVPLIHDGEWSFSDLEEDPHEQDTLAAMEFGKLVRDVEAKHGVDAAKWAEEAAFATRWWLKENHERWRYTS